MTSLALCEAIIDNGTINENALCISNYAREHFLLDKSSGKIAEINCKSWRCPKHAGKWLHRWKVIVAREVELTPINKLITLTCASICEPGQLSLARQLLFRELRKIDENLSYLSVLEFTTQSRLPHLHILARSGFIRQKHLSRQWQKATEAAKIKPSKIVYISKPRSQKAGAFYALSYALNGAAKDQDIPSDWQGRKITYSKNFFTKPAKEHWVDYIIETYGSTDLDADWHIRRYDLLPDFNLML